MIEQALRVANKLGLPPDQTARLLVAAEPKPRPKPRPEPRRVVSLVEPFYLTAEMIENFKGLSAPAFIDDRKPRGRRPGARRGRNSWD